MNLSMKRISALITKEYQDLKTNSQILIMVALPLVFAFLISRTAHASTPDSATMPILILLTMVTCYTQSLLIAEEKEKHTLRVLMLSPASSVEILTGKAFLTFIMTLVTCGLCFFILGTEIRNVWLTAGVILLSSVLFTIFGTIIGLFSENVTQTSIYGLPFMFIMMMGPNLKEVISNETLLKIVSYLPSDHLAVGMVKAMEDGTFADIKMNLFNILIWTIVSGIVCFFVYNKRRFDK
ncbi:ABC transporter permease [Bacillus sp. REN10]|uniref:ABC transporter permease n=1 Tax=Bacillus sp. REN10 TaxID=2782541 RepID=UPI00193B3244|nr:ABC transporter permease [Bacillus sp. REN10]